MGFYCLIGHPGPTLFSFSALVIELGEYYVIAWVSLTLKNLVHLEFTLVNHTKSGNLDLWSWNAKILGFRAAKPELLTLSILLTKSPVWKIRSLVLDGLQNKLRNYWALVHLWGEQEMKHQRVSLCFFLFASSVSFHAGLQLRKKFHGKRVKKFTIQEWIIKYSKNVREKYGTPQGTPRGSERGERLELPHAEPSATSSSGSYSATPRQGFSPFVSLPSSRCRRPFLGKFIDTVS